MPRQLALAPALTLATVASAACGRGPTHNNAPPVAHVPPVPPATPTAAPLAAAWQHGWPSPVYDEEAATVVVPPPRCFAYSPDRRAYACIGFAFDPEVDMDAYPDGVATGYVDIVGLGGPGGAGAPLVESHPVWSSVGQPVETSDAVEARLGALGLTAPPSPIDPVRLRPGRPVAVGAASIRYHLDLHEGDASFEYFGDVTVVCGGGREQALEVRERGLELGDDAWLLRAAGAPAVAVAVHGMDGGEGVEWHGLATVVLDPAAVCAGAAGAVAGPIEARAQG